MQVDAVQTELAATTSRSSGSPSPCGKTLSTVGRRAELVLRAARLDLRGDERPRPGPDSKGGSDDRLAAAVRAAVSMTLTPRSNAVCRARMPSSSSNGPNQPAKPIAPNPSTLSRSPVAGKSDIPRASPSLGWQVRGRGRAECTSGRRRSSCSRLRDAHPRSAPSRDGPVRRRARGLAGAAGAFGAGGQHADAGFLDDRQDRAVRGHGERQARCASGRPRRPPSGPVPPAAWGRTAPGAGSRSASRWSASRPPRGAVPGRSSRWRCGARAYPARRREEKPGLVLRPHRHAIGVAGSSSRKAMDARCRPP